ncbi:MAG: hypothetical protein ABJO41_13265 [Erythrobacter sp.]
MPRRSNLRWKDLFIERLAQSSNVTLSAQYAGKSKSHAYRERASDPEFARRWLEALKEGYDHLELEVLRRLRDGDHMTCADTKYDFANAIRLLNAHRDSATKAKALEGAVSANDIKESIDRKIAEFRAQSMHGKSKNPVRGE